VRGDSVQGARYTGLPNQSLGVCAVNACRWFCLYTLAVSLAACSAGTAPPPTAIPAPPTAIPAPTRTGPRAVIFKTGDGAELHGTLYGHGDTAIVLSNMGDNDPAPWEAFAPQLAARGYSVLTYAYRYPMNASGFDNLRARQTLDDLRAAIAFVRAEGAQHLALVGASLGGMITAKAAGEAKAIALIVMAAPVDLPTFDFRVEPAELQALDMPKLFVGSEQDRNVPLADTQRMYDLTPDPKDFHSYPGTAHGTQLFQGPSADDLTRRLIDFVSTHAPPI
jgi:uncharacterized protein